MMTKIVEWNNIMSDFGITKKDHIVIYDNLNFIVHVDYGLVFYILAMIPI